jgi:hypothetical protein
MPDENNKVANTPEHNDVVPKQEQASDKQETQEASSDTPDPQLPEDIPSEFFDNLPPSIKEHFAFISKQGSHSSGITEKLTPEHINKVIDYSEEENKRDHHQANKDRWFRFFCVTVIAFLFVFSAMYLVENNMDSFKWIIEIGIAVAGGIGYGKSLKK